MIKVTAGLLQSFEAFKEVPQEQLDWMLLHSRDQYLLKGDLLFEPGTPIDSTYIFISGRVSLYVLRNNEEREFALAEATAIHGYLPFSRGYINFAYGRALEDTQLLLFPVELMHEMICKHFELTQALVHVMSSRVRDLTARQQQDEKMMALGKLSAGLAHELNNPASAIIRGSGALKDHLKAIRMIFHKILEYRLGSDVIEVVNLLFTKILDENSKTRPGMIERNLKELQMADWLRNRKIVGAEAIADDLNALGLDIDDAQKFLRCIPDHWASAGMEWLHNTLVMERMVSDIEDSSKRIAELIGSVKKFTHMDQGQGMRYADIHEGIRNTIIMLQHRIRKDNVSVVENFDRELPPVKAMIGELNQVWTNLIDNALDAMEESSDGVLELYTKSDGKSIFVTVADNGTGIPEEIASSVFDPFFTTKPVGKGTGLGLDVVMRIVRQHSGTVKLKSRPGRTEFVVCFPINGR